MGGLQFLNAYHFIFQGLGSRTEKIDQDEEFQERILNLLPCPSLPAFKRGFFPVYQDLSP
jgi:hypothetical protein